jgi:hypothetical protein
MEVVVEDYFKITVSGKASLHVSNRFSVDAGDGYGTGSWVGQVGRDSGLPDV